MDTVCDREIKQGKGGERDRGKTGVRWEERRGVGTNAHIEH